MTTTQLFHLPPGTRGVLGVLVLGLLLGLGGCAGAGATKPDLSLDELATDINAVAIDEAERDLEAGRHEAARGKFGRMIAIDPSNARARVGLGETALALGNPPAALDAFSSATENPEQKARALQGTGLALLAMGRGEEANAALLAAVEANPDQWRAWNAIGRYRDSVEAWQGATEAYERALAATGARAAVVLNNLGMSLMLQERFAEASATFSESLGIEPQQETVRTNLRLALAWQGRYAEATAGISPERAGEAYNNIGYVAMLRGDYETAESLLLRAMETSPSFNQQAAENLRALADVTGRGTALTQ